MSEDRRKVVPEAVFERMADMRVQRRLEVSSAYRNAENAEAQSEAEQAIERQVIADLEQDYRIDPYHRTEL